VANTELKSLGAEMDSMTIDPYRKAVVGFHPTSRRRWTKAGGGTQIPTASDLPMPNP
jgi:hypothetical protein